MATHYSILVNLPEVHDFLTFADARAYAEEYMRMHREQRMYVVKVVATIEASGASKITLHERGLTHKPSP